jgi:hypothetical protein
MYKLFSFIVFGILMSFSSFGKETKVAGDWLLTKIETPGGTKEVYDFVKFDANGDFVFMNMKLGVWKYNQKSNVVELSSEKFALANGNNSVVELNGNKMILENKGNKMYFLRIDFEKVSEDNKNSGLEGTWKTIPGESNVLRIFVFKLPDTFSYVEKIPGVETTGDGRWIYKKNDNSLLLVARIEDLDNVFKVEKISPDKILLKSKNTTFTLVKDTPVYNIENLNFTEDDFFDRDGNYKYEGDEEKLPWNDEYRMYEYLSGVKKLEYKYSSLVNGTKVFQTKTLVANVSTGENQNRVCVDFIFYGYDKEHLPDDTDLPPNCVSDNNFYNRLFPEKELDFRVVGKEDVKVAAGNFKCTVVEAVGMNDNKFRMWMIDDKPGVYAKIIEQNSDSSFGYYHAFELLSIK